jgi:methylenetetrahydrofolate reductase (NADPH)
MRPLRQWVVKRSALFEKLYRVLEPVILAAKPLVEMTGSARLQRPVAALERICKGALFDCRMCGRCILSSSGFSCPTNCPKSLRNGPCGGVRPDGTCEVDCGMRCVWVDAWEGSGRMQGGQRILALQPPMERNIQGSSAWLRLIAESGSPKAAPKPKDETVPPMASAPVNPFEETLRAGRFAVTAEISPPDSAEPEDVYKRVMMFEGHVDAVNVTDGSGGNCHTSSLGVSVLLARKGFTPVLQITCRDRNRIAIQGDILGAAVLGISNILCLTGDGVASGDQPGAVPVFDLDSLSLLETARGLRDRGRYLSGRPLSHRPKLFLGAAANPFSPPYENRALHLAKKVAAGAQFIQTQYCFDVPMLESFMRQVRDLGLHRQCHILIGVGPIVSARTARWMRERVPGVRIPDHLIARLEKAQDQRKEGRAICIEMIQQIREIEGVAGVHLMAHRHEELIVDVIKETGIRNLPPRPQPLDLTRAS